MPSPPQREVVAWPLHVGGSGTVPTIAGGKWADSELLAITPLPVNGAGMVVRLTPGAGSSDSRSWVFGPLDPRWPMRYRPSPSVRVSELRATLEKAPGSEVSAVLWIELVRPGGARRNGKD